MDSIAVVLGNPITVGAVASFLLKILKGVGWFPVFENQPLRSRVVVAVMCLLINSLVNYMQGVFVADWVLVGETFMSYLTAAATYDHIFKSR